MYFQFGHLDSGHNSVPRNVTYVFYNNDGMLLHIFMEVNEFY